MKLVGFFGGTFDPLHFGHVGLAVRLLEMYHLDEILFCPAFCSPFKVDRQPLASPSQRLEILQVALDHPKFKISTLEIEEGGVSYTIDTLKKLQRPGVDLRLLLSEEAAEHFNLWKSPEEIVKIAPLLIGKRDFPISSTEIRARLQKNLYCAHLVPAKALDYIKKNRLYC